MDAQILQKLINNIANRQTSIYDVIYLYGSEQGVRSTLDAVIEKCSGKRIIRTDGIAFLEETQQHFLTGRCACLIVICISLKISKSLPDRK